MFACSWPIIFSLFRIRTSAFLSIQLISSPKFPFFYLQSISCIRESLQTLLCVFVLVQVDAGEIVPGWWMKDGAGRVKMTMLVKLKDDVFFDPTRLISPSPSLIIVIVFIIVTNWSQFSGTIRVLHLGGYLALD